MKPNTTAPTKLEKPESDWLATMKEEYCIQDSAGIAVITKAAQQQQLVRKCDEQIEADGFLTAKGRVHPLFSVRRDANNSFIACIRLLGLDIESAGSVGAPIGAGGAAHKPKKVRVQ